MKQQLLLSAMLLAVSASAQQQPCHIPLNHVSNFTSVLPSAQPDSLRIPSSHVFQLLVQEGDPYSDTANGAVKSLFDFTGYVPLNGSSRKGFISLNHEGGNAATGGVSILDMQFDTASSLWQVTHKMPVDFSGIAGTGRNCSGGVTPWGTSITSEETLPSGDANGDGYQDIGWNVEIDPVTRSIKDYNNDTIPDKLWKMGRMSHENVVVSNDSITVYEANDENPGYIFKFVAATPGDLSDGDLFVLRLDGGIDVSSTGSWRKVPNSTPTECNNVRAAATSLGATNFNSLEDVEISPLDGMIYFVSKASSRVYRFKDFGNTVNNFEIFAGNPSQNYKIDYEGGGTAYEQWRDGNDNLTFDNLGNLYVIQDGGRNHIWMITPCHTQADPDVRLFAVTPAGCEPTGMTFSPDYRYMFVSMQHPSSSNTVVQVDAAGNNVVFNKETAIVISHRGYLGNTDTTIDPTHVREVANSRLLEIASVYPNPAGNYVKLSISSPVREKAFIKVYSMTGAAVITKELTMDAGFTNVVLNTSSIAAGTYNVIVTTGTQQVSTRIVKQ